MIAARIRRPRLWLHIVIWVIVIFLLGWTVRSVPLHALWRILKQMDPRILGVLIVANVLILWCFAARGWIILRALGYHIPYYRQVMYRLSAFSVNYFTPGPQFGGEPLHVYLLTHNHDIPWETALTTVVVDRLFEWLVNLVFLMLGIGVLLALGFLPGTAQMPMFMGVMLVFLLPFLYILFLMRGHRPLRAVLSRTQKRIPVKAHAPLQRLEKAEEEALHLYRKHPRTLLIALGISMGTWGLLIGEYALMIWALGIHLTLPHIIAVMTAARLAFLFPTPGGLGALEAGQALALHALGYDPALGLSLSLLIRARDIGVGIIGVLWGKWILGGYEERKPTRYIAMNPLHTHFIKGDVK